MTVNFKSDVTSANTNAAYISKTADDEKTGNLALNDGASTQILETQKVINQVMDTSGETEGDVNRKVYSSNNKITDGDNKKVAIGKLDQAVQDNEDAINSINILHYKGIWNATTNTPTLADGTGVQNDWYRVNVAGTQDLGSGPITYQVGDRIVHDGSVWERWDSISDVTSVHSRVGDVVSANGDYNADQINETATRFFDIKHNNNAIVDPTVNEDSGDNYSVGSTWFNSASGAKFTLQDATVGAAVWVETGGAGGGGGLDVFYTEQFEINLSADVTDKGNSLTLVGGVLAGTLADETTNPIKNITSLKYTQALGSLNDFYFLPDTYTTELKDKNNDAGLTFYFNYNGDANDMAVIVYDVTNSTILTSSLDLLTSETDSTRYSTSYFVPSTCNEYKIGFHVKVENIGAVLIVDEFEGSLSPYVYKDLLDINMVSLSDNGGEIITANTENIVFNGTGKGWDDTNYEYTTQRSDSILTLSGLVTVNANIKKMEVYKNSTLYKAIGSVDEGSFARGDINITLIGGEDYVQGDTISIRTSSGFTLTSTSTAHHLTIIEQATTEHVVTPAKSNPNTYSARITSAGAVTSESLPGWITNSTTGSGTMTIDYTGLGLTVPPTTHINMEHNPGAGSITYGITSISNTSVTYTLSQSGVGPVTRNITFFLTRQSPDTKDSTFLAAIPTQKTAYIKDVKASGVNGGTASAITVYTRDLNTLTGDTSFVTLGSNQFTLEKGIYDISWSAPACYITYHQTHLYNITNSVIAAAGSSESSGQDGTVKCTRSMGDERLEILTQTTYEIRHHTTSTRATDGLGRDSASRTNNPVSENVYTTIKITKVR